MKYINFKRYKLSTIFKNINFRRYNLYKIPKFFNTSRYNIFKTLKFLDIRRYNFSKILKILDIRRYNFSKILKILDIRRYNFSKIFRSLNFKKFKNVPAYLVAISILIALIYISIPIFYNYDKSKIENIVCKDFKFKCTIQGKVKYSFIPTPRIKFNNFIIRDLSDKSKVLAKIEKVAINISLRNLINKEKFNYSSIKLTTAEINLDLKKFNKYKKFYNEKFNFKPIILKKGTINFYEDKQYITNLKNIKFQHSSNKKMNKSVLKGKFLNDKISIKLQDNKNDKKISKILFLKLTDSKLLTKINVFNKSLKTNSVVGNILFKQNKSRLTAIFNYKDYKVNFNKANLSTPFFDGKLNGQVDFLPFFIFDVNADLNAINFNKLQNFITNLSEKNRKDLFKVHKKINGKLNLSTNKVYSKSNLVKSFESRIKFINGNILIEQFLFNLGKLGAADLIGIIENEGKFTNLKFEKNIFIDNKKYFFSKFGIYNKKDISSNLFISGNVNLANLNLHIYEISESDDKKLSLSDINYVEKEFNEILFEDGYKTFFDYLKLKEYVKLVVDESD